MTNNFVNETTYISSPIEQNNVQWGGGYYFFKLN